MNICKVNIRVRIFVLIFVLVTAAIMAISYLLLSELESRMYTEFRERGSVIVKYFALNSVDGIVSRDHEMLTRSIQKLFGLEDVIYAAIFDQNNESIVSVPTAQIKHNLQTGKSGQITTVQIKEVKTGANKTFEVLDFLCPVFDGTGKYIGSVQAGLSVERIYVDINETVIRTSIILSIFWVIGMIMSFIIANNIAQPIKKLTAISKSIADGNLDMEVPVHRTDEIGSLAQSLTELRDSIRNKIQKLEEEAVSREKLLKALDKKNELLAISRENLEHKVQERTRELQESEEKFRKYFELGVVGMAAITPDKKFTYFNDRICEMFGYSRDVLIHMYWDELCYKEDSENANEQFSRMLAGEFDGYSLDTRYVRKDGQTIYTSVSLKCMRNEYGAVKLIFAIIQDITDRKKMEEELIKTRKLESVGILAGGIAHDFNNLLTAIIGNISLIKLDMPAADKKYKFLESAERASMQAKELSHRLLTFSKGGAPVKKTLSIGDLVKESTLFTLKGSNIKCEFNIPDNLFPVHVDEGQFNQVISNLVINAQQAMPCGGSIKVTCENFVINADDSYPVKPGKYVSISIQDQGVGIPEEYIEKIFDPYFTTKEKTAQRGTGLGLSTCYSIITKHNGCITVNSKPAEGSTFHIFLPAADQITGPVHTVVKRETKAIRGSGRILVMDDEELVRKSVGSMLHYMGYSVEFAKDGSQAIRMYQRAVNSNKPYDAVILDLTVPGGMGGKETIVRLREQFDNVKAVVSSGYSNDPILAHYKDYGFDNVIGKPYNANEISAVIHSIMES